MCGSETEKEIAAAAAERFGEEAAASMPPGGLLLRGSGLWIVRVGGVRLFSVMADGDGGYGKRSFLFDAGAGCVLFGPGEPQERPPVAMQSGVWAVGLDSAELVPVSRSSVEALAADPALRRWLTGQLERWKEAWRQALAGEDEAGSITELPLAAELMPADVSDWWSGLDAFHAQALTTLRRLREKEALAEQVRLEARTAQDRDMLSRALARLHGVHNEDEDLVSFDEAEEPNSLLAAAQAVGRYLGIEVQQSPFASSGAGTDPLEAIADASRFRIRKVTLAGRWWREDNGPLLAFAEPDGRPVALLPFKPGRYRLFDPADDSLQDVTETTAKELKDTAYMFYKPLPFRTLKLIDIVRAGVQRGIWRDLVVMLLLGATVGLLGLLTPVLTGILYDKIVPDADRPQLVQMACILASSAVAIFLFETARGIAMLRIEGRVDMTIQAAVWDRLLRLPVSFFRGYSSGDLSMRANSISAIRRKLSGIAVSSLFSGLFSVFYLVLLFMYHPGIALIALGLSVSGLMVASVFSFVQLRYQREFMQHQGQLRSLMVQLLAGIAKFRVAAAESRAFSLWANLFSKQNRIQFQMSKLESYYAVFQAMFPIATSMALYYAVVSFGAKSIGPGRFIAFFAAFSALQSGLMAMSASLLSILSVVTLYERAKPILQALPEEADGGEFPGTLGGGLELSHVFFRYEAEGAWTVRDISLRVNPGAFVAIVGESGSGKSTLLRLMLGFEKPASGQVSYDGKNLAGLDVQAVRRQMGVVLQNGGLLAGDLYSNIVGSSELSVDDAWEAARIAGLEEDIRDMPMEMYTVLPDGGGMLSGGQVQRLLIARAVVRKPRLLFFDEATSALDNRTQAAVSDSLGRLRATRIVIAHRLSTVRHADMIVVLNRGEIVQQGTYDELMSQGGLFADMARRQTV
ncbi:NHLP bacteriocin export ABC transporter permease/ATPase subunit [Paenibacillus cymbidii]|uniref:NHLP bacteriocin export ABC transporter permease/ATPase subunit n=1 Tax=Paenibacillus cymbidii TaxID=1639034 RepID=UPI0010809A02|nr:NHLP bacteriocin export ABC transporter permease/ATPase subunit [Paenibacillus cymbidii]